jgi:hypothetical protein
MPNTQKSNILVKTHFSDPALTIVLNSENPFLHLNISKVLESVIKEASSSIKEIINLEDLVCIQLSFFIQQTSSEGFKSKESIKQSFETSISLFSKKLPKICFSLEVLNEMIPTVCSYISKFPLSDARFLSLWTARFIPLTKQCFDLHFSTHSLNLSPSKI